MMIIIIIMMMMMIIIIIIANCNKRKTKSITFLNHYLTVISLESDSKLSALTNKTHFKLYYNIYVAEQTAISKYKYLLQTMCICTSSLWSVN